MKNAEKKNLIFGFLSKAGLKRVVIALYCIVPLLIFAVGFSAWTIIGHDVTSGGGSFVADGIINSYDYIAINTGSFGGINLYPTGFYDKDNNTVTNQANIEVSYTLHIGECKKLVENSANKTLYADFRLNFAEGGNYEAFYRSLDCSLSLTSYNGAAFGVKQSFNSASQTVSVVINLEDYNYTGTGDDTCTLTFTYTVNPEAGDYQTIYNNVVGNGKKLAIDVRITDIDPTKA